MEVGAGKAPPHCVKSEELQSISMTSEAKPSGISVGTIPKVGEMKMQANSPTPQVRHDCSQRTSPHEKSKSRSRSLAPVARTAPEARARTSESSAPDCSLEEGSSAPDFELAAEDLEWLPSPTFRSIVSFPMW